MASRNRPSTVQFPSNLPQYSATEMEAREEGTEATYNGKRRSRGMVIPEPKLLPSQCSYVKSMSSKSISYSKITFFARRSTAYRDRSLSTFTLKSSPSTFFCDWMFVLFGIDQDVVPYDNEFDEEGNAFADDGEGGGGRTKPKELLTGKDGKKFECICDVDEFYERHYVPRYGGGLKENLENWKVPHFSSYWDDHKERLAAIEDASLLQMVDTKLGREPEAAAPINKPYLRSFGTNPQEARKRILKSLRPLTCRELRRYRMAFSEAIILELQEDGYQDTAQFLKNLIIDEYQFEQGKGKFPTLRDSKAKLQRLVPLLKAAEKKGRKQEYNVESTILLKTGKYFSDSDPTWWWLADRLFQKAVDAASKCVIDGGKSEAIAHFIYGVFLLNFEGNVHRAQEHLNRARELSAGREWNASRIIEKANEPIHKECTNHLCRALIETSKSLRRMGKPEEALPFIHQSYKLCRESQTMRPNIELDTFFELGSTYQACGQLEWAKTAFKTYIAKAKLEAAHRRICDGHLELAICFRMEGEINQCHYHLQSYLKHASANEDENLIAFGNRYLGEFLLNLGYSHEAIPYFDEAFHSFLDQCLEAQQKPCSQWLPEEFTLPQDVEMARVLTGLAKGEILTKPICSLILRARDVRNQTDTLKLLRWKNSQEILFETMERPPPVKEDVIEMGSLISSSQFFSMTSAV